MISEPGSADRFDDSQDAESLRLARRVLCGLNGAVDQVVIAPGSRNAPLAYALREAEEQGAFTVHVRTDERAAAFTALGIALRSGRAAAVVTTSGTAVGNLMPAVMEADHAGVPLVVITADRPEELHGIGTNQTTEQRGLFSGRVRAELHLEQGRVQLEPGSPPGQEAVEHQVGSAVIRAVHQGLSPQEGGSGSGPMHLNIGFRDPLVPQPDGRAVGGSRGWISPARGTMPLAVQRPPSAFQPPEAVEAERRRWAQPLEERRTVVVLGHESPVSIGVAQEAFELARSLGHPVLAEPTSGAREAGPGVVQGYRLILGADDDAPFSRLREQVQRVVVAGRPTLSRAVQRLLGRDDVEAIHYLPFAEPWYRQASSLPRPVVSDLSELREFAGQAPAGWQEAWDRAGHRMQHLIDSELDAEPALSSVGAARFVAEHTHHDLLLGSSSAIRDVDLVAELRGMEEEQRTPRRIHALRGVSGIDGNLSAAAGLALAAGSRATALVGDLTFLHDLNALLVPAMEQVPLLDVVVLNDEGGAIFDQIEHGAVARREGQRAAVERFFGTPHRAGIEQLVRGYGHEYLRAQSLGELEAALAGAEKRRGIRVVEVRTDRSGLRDFHARLLRRASAADGDTTA